MDFQILGPLEVRKDGRPVSLRAAKQRTLLAILLVHANEVVSSDRLVEELWSEPPATAAQALQVYVTQLRKALEPERVRGDPAKVLLTRSPGYVLRVEPDELDSQRFERLLAAGRSEREMGRPQDAGLTLRDALALWRGPALADFTYEPFAQGEIARLEELRLAALEERIDADLAHGRDAELVGELEAAIREHPLRERLRGQLMLALYRSGRQAEALDAYRDTRHVLDEQLGIAPGPELRRLEEAILRQEPALDASVEAPAESSVPTEQPATAAGEPQVRKTVTVLVAGLGREAGLDPEAGTHEQERFRDELGRIVARYGGELTGSLGDRLVAAFGVPSVHEDDPLRAASAALEVRDALAGGGEQPAVRAGVATGEVLASPPSAAAASVTGPPVALAGELEAAASAGEILIAEATGRHVREHARLEASDTGGGTWRLLELARAPPPLAAATEAPLVGRQSELRRLAGAFAQVVRDRSAQVATVLGPAGIGKSRLAREFASLVGSDATVLAGRCVPYGEGITYWPLDEILSQLDASDQVGETLGEGEHARRLGDRLAEMIGVAESLGSQEEIFWAARELLQTLARDRALVVVFEDLHWAEPSFLDLVAYLAEMGGSRILLLCIARPELLEQRPDWGERPNAITLVLDPLPDAESEAMIGSLSAELPPGTRTRVMEAAEGNPLFIEQLVAKLGEEGGPEGELPIPSTIEAVLAARLDRLGPAERAVLAGAAVMGREFPARAAVDLSPAEARPFVIRHLEALAGKDLIGVAAQTPIGGEGFRFRHILIQQAAYRAVSKRMRADLHEEFARWVDERAREGLTERSDIVGFHLEQAFGYRAELGPLADEERALGRRAGEQLASAGQRAFRRGDMPASVNLLGRAASLLEAEQAELPLLPELGYALFEIGEEERAIALLEGAEARARTAEDRKTAWRALVTRRRAEMYRDPAETDVDALGAEAEAAIEVLGELGDAAGLSRAWIFLSDIHWCKGRLGATIEASSRAANHARRIGNRREVGWALGQNALCAIHSPMPVADALSWIERLLRDEPENRTLDANLSGFVTVLEAMAGRFEEARRHIDETRALARDLGLTWQASVQELNSGYIELLAGDPVSAERQMRVAQEALREIGDGWFLATATLDLLRALYEQGRYDDAFAELESMGEPPAPDRENQIKSRGVPARLLARRRRLDEAEALARDAVRLGASSEFLVLHAEALTDLADVLEIAGRDEEAAEATAEAIRLFEQKGNVAAARKARALALG